MSLWEIRYFWSLTPLRRAIRKKLEDEGSNLAPEPDYRDIFPWWARLLQFHRR